MDDLTATGGHVRPCAPDLSIGREDTGTRYQAIKRLADILFAGIALALSLPFWV